MRNLLFVLSKSWASPSDLSAHLIYNKLESTKNSTELSILSEIIEILEKFIANNENENLKICYEKNINSNAPSAPISTPVRVVFAESQLNCNESLMKSPLPETHGLKRKASVDNYSPVMKQCLDSQGHALTIRKSVGFSVPTFENNDSELNFSIQCGQRAHSTPDKNPKSCLNFSTRTPLTSVEKYNKSYQEGQIIPTMTPSYINTLTDSVAAQLVENCTTSSTFGNRKMEKGNMNLPHSTLITGKLKQNIIHPMSAIVVQKNSDPKMANNYVYMERSSIGPWMKFFHWFRNDAAFCTISFDIMMRKTLIESINN